jgi:hypothetical protein
MTKAQFLTAIKAAGFEVENNRVYIKNDLGVTLADVLLSKGFSSKVVDNGRGKLFTEYTHPAANFAVNAKKTNPPFATVDLI